MQLAYSADKTFSELEIYAAILSFQIKANIIHLNQNDFTLPGSDLQNFL
jgi:hypothetical protein